MNTKKAAIHIILTDDHRLFADALSEILITNFNYNVLRICLDGNDLLEWLSKSPILPDVLLLDINMEPMDGYEVFEVINKLYPAIRVLAVTMDNKPEQMERILKAGFHGIVLKNEDSVILNKAIMEAHEKGAYVSDVIAKLLYKIARDKDKSKEPNLKLTDREFAFLKLCADEKEYSYKEIADILCVSARTVDGYRDSLFAKLNLKRRTGLVTYFLKMKP